MNKERVFNSQIVVSLPFAVKEESTSTSFISIYLLYPNWFLDVLNIKY